MAFRIGARCLNPQIACVEHFSMEPLSFILRELLVEEGSQVLGSEKNALLPEVFKSAFDLPSYARNKLAEQTSENLAQGLSELKRLQKCWSTVVLDTGPTFMFWYKSAKWLCAILMSQGTYPTLMSWYTSAKWCP